MTVRIDIVSDNEPDAVVYSRIALIGNHGGLSLSTTEGLSGLEGVLTLPEEPNRNTLYFVTVA